MRYMTAVPATIVAAFLMLSASGHAQAPKEGSTLTIAGNSGEARLLQINGKAYVEVESLARLTKGTLSFQATRTILTLPAADSQAPVATPPVKVVFTRAFVQAGIEEMGSIREWRIVIVRAVQNNVPVLPEWIAAHAGRKEPGFCFGRDLDRRRPQRVRAAQIGAEQHADAERSLPGDGCAVHGDVTGHLRQCAP